ncbi:ATP-grasp domain-containing protein [Streptomyces violascens]|uniref:ATP-grasp domain-containing protein n=1 Tax=Streptomyces violascens TaxID=67381 RepID=UPI0036476C56
MSRVLLIGSDRNFAEACVSRGLDVVAVRNASVFSNGLLTFPEEVRQVAVPNQSDLEQVVSGLGHAGLTMGDFDAVYTNFEFAVVMAAGLAQNLGLPGLGTEVAVRMRDKFLQKQRLAEKGIPVAESRVFHTPPTLADVEALGFPLVLKPVAGAGTESTTRVDDATAFQRTVAAFFSAKEARKVLLVEQFIAGEEFVLDGWIHNGVIGFSSLGRYERPCLEIAASATSMRMYRCSETTHPGLAERATNLAADALTALGMRSGVFHLEFFRLPNGSLVFSECAARRGGALVEEEIRLARSVSLAEAAVDLCLGTAPQTAPTAQVLEVGSIHPKLPAGVILDLPNIHRLTQQDGVDYVRYFTYLGATSSGNFNSTDQRSAAMLAGAPTLAELDKRLEHVETLFLDETVLSPNVSPRHMREFQVQTLGRSDLADRSYTAASAGTSPRRNS